MIALLVAVALAQGPAVSDVPPLPADLAQVARQLDAAMHVAGYEHPMADPPRAASVLEGLEGERGGTELAIRVTMFNAESNPERAAELARLKSTPDGWRCYAARGLYAAIGAWGGYLRAHGREPGLVTEALKPLYKDLREKARACWDDHGQGPGSSRGAMDAERAWTGKRLEAFESFWSRASARGACIAFDGAAGACAPGVQRLSPGEALLLAAAVAVGLVPESGPVAWPVLARRLAEMH